MEDEDAGFIDVSFAKDGGVMKKILQEAPADAKGPPPNGNEVEAHYTGEYEQETRRKRCVAVVVGGNFVFFTQSGGPDQKIV